MSIEPIAYPTVLIWLCVRELLNTKLH